jgi:hypothetical protein
LSHWLWQKPKVQISPVAHSLFSEHPVPGAGFPDPPPQPDSSDAVTKTKPAATDRIEKLILLDLPRLKK